MKYVAHLIGISIVSAIFYLTANFLEKDFMLSEWVIPPAGVKLEQWLDIFKFWATIIISSSLAACLLWYVFTQWIIRINKWSASNKRILWGLFFLLPIVVIILGFVFTQQAQEGNWLAYTFYILNGIFCYYFATALFSPSSFKYIPIFASKIRRWW